MGRLQKLWVWGLIGLVSAGCTIDNATLAKIGIEDPPWERTPVENPLLVALPQQEKDRVFEAAYQVLDNYGFDILDSNRHDGRIETMPRVAPGVALFLKPGSPDLHERCLASLQTYQHRVLVLVLESKEKGGIFVDVKVRKELEDLPRPIKSTVGAAIFRLDNNIERQFEVIDASSPSVGTFDPYSRLVRGPRWIYKGRDPAMEQELVQRIKSALKLH